MNQLLTSRQLAAKLQVSTRHITSMRSKELIPPPLRVGRAIRRVEAEVDAWLKAGAPNMDKWKAIQGKGRA